MNVTKLQEKLVAVARQNPPSDHVPYAFEKRIMAHLARPVIDVWTVWGKALWRAAGACVIAMVLLAGWMSLQQQQAPEFSQQFEETVFVALDEHPSDILFEDSW